MNPCGARVTIAGLPTCVHPKCEKFNQTVGSNDCNDRCTHRVILNQDGSPMMPSVVTKSKNLVNTLAQSAVGGAAKASDEAVKQRLSVCGSCPLKVKQDCSQCGCNIELKAQLVVSSCPMRYWEHIPVDMQAGQLLPEPEFIPSQLSNREYIYTDTETYKERTGCCDNCSFRAGRRCKDCACDVYTIARLTKSTCPQGRWKR